MRHDWKTTLYLYVDQHNRSEVDDRPRAIHAPMTDMEHALLASERARRMASWFESRGASPTKSETRAKLLRTHVAEQEVTVDLEFHIRRGYEQKGLPLKDERIERERLTLLKEGTGWVVAKVEVPVPERRGQQLVGAEQERASRSNRSLPLLNRDVLGPSTSLRAIPYRRDKAVAYADEWWNEPNPRFLSFEVDCTNYISQCLFAGSAPMNYTGRRDSGWWYKGMVNGQEAWSYSWAVANSLERHLTNSTYGLRAELVEHPGDLQLGDVIAYDWDGNGHYQHTTMVTAFDANGMPLVNAHTVSSRHRYWDYQDSYAWTEATRYRFFHIVDAF